jgi:anti-sigma B factor antagonist
MTPHDIFPPHDRLRFSARRTDGYTIATLTGELDVACSPVLREQLLGVLTPRTSRLVVDLSKVTFCDASGLAVLLSTGRRASLLGGALRLAAPAPVVVAALRMSGLLRQFSIFPTVLAATAPPPAAGRVADARTQAYKSSGTADAEPAAQAPLLSEVGVLAARDLREAVAALLAHADAWRDADPDRRFTGPLRALARAQARNDHVALGQAARSLVAMLTRYPLTYSPAVAATASDLRRLISSSPGLPAPA